MQVRDADAASVDGIEKPILLVELFDQDVDDAGLQAFAKGLSRDILTGLAAFSGLDVVMASQPAEPTQGTNPVRVRRVTSAYTLRGGVESGQDGYRVTALLEDVESGRLVWAEDFDVRTDQGAQSEARKTAGYNIARAIAQPYGAIYANEVGASLTATPGALTSYGCVIRFYHYWRTYRRESYQTVRDCLETVIARHPNHAEARAALSLMVIDGFRFGFVANADPGESLSQAITLASEAIDLEPRNVRGYHALLLGYWLSGDVERSLAAAETGLSLSPGDTELMADLGFRYCVRNLCDKGFPLVQEAFVRNPMQPSVYRMAFFIHHFTEGRFDAALAEARKIEAPDLIYAQVIRAAAEVRAGEQAAARATVARILSTAPDFADTVKADLQRRNIHPDIIGMIIAALREAGMKVEPSKPI